MSDPSRRRFLASLGIAALHPMLGHSSLANELRLSEEPAIAAPESLSHAARGLRIRAITAGLEMKHIGDHGAIKRGLDALASAQERFESEGYEVPTSRVTMPPVIAQLDASARNAALPVIANIDALVVSRGAVCSLGP